MLRLYMDHHVPGPITDGLRQRGVDVVTAEEDGAKRLDDDLLFDRATALGWVLFSQDKDLLALAHHRQKAGNEFARLAYAHQLRISIGQAIGDLEFLAKALEPDDMRNRVEYLPYS
jgi:Domain of unknown function (DUF5615)